MTVDPMFAGLRAYLAQKAREGHDCRFVRQAEPEEALPTEAPSLHTAVHHVEGKSLAVVDTGYRAREHSDVSGFRFFLDGVQFSHPVAYVDNVPIVYHVSAAIILQRDPETRELHVWRPRVTRRCVLVPFQFLDPSDFEAHGVPAVDTVEDDGPVPLDAVGLRARAHSRAQRLRRALEVEVIQEWAQSGEEGWLMVDGPLVPLPGLTPPHRLVGVIKTFNAQFFEGAQQLRILTLPAGHRTTAFILPRGSRPREADDSEARQWFSWYVRIREPADRGPEFGLIRVETPPEPEVLAAADEISRWLIAERAPLSTPDPRWDSLLYPICACERYLKSTLPHRHSIHLLLR